MANKTGLSYYSVDTDRYMDIRIKRLKKDYGCRGLAVYDYLLCEVYRVRGCFAVWDESTAFDVAEYLGLKESNVHEIVKYCGAVGLFDKALLSRGIITSASIQRRYLDMCKRARRQVMIIPKEYRITEESPQITEESPQITESLLHFATKKSKVNISSPTNVVEDILPNPPFEEGIRLLSVTDDSAECNRQVRDYLTENGFEWKAEVHVPERGDGYAGRVDLIAQRGTSEKYAIEIDWLSPREKSIVKLRQLDESFSKIILLRGGTQNGMIGDDIQVISLQTVDSQRKGKVARKGKELDLSIVEPAFQPVVADWLAYKSERGQTYRQRGFESLYRRLVELSGGNADTARRIVEQSKANNWAGLFSLKTTNDYGRNADNRVANGDITNDELMRRCEERVRARLARSMAREMGADGGGDAEAF